MATQMLLSTPMSAASIPDGNGRNSSTPDAEGGNCIRPDDVSGDNFERQTEDVLSLQQSTPVETQNFQTCGSESHNNHFTEDDVEITLRDAPADRSLNEETMLRNRPNVLSLLDYSPDIIRNLSLTPNHGSNVTTLALSPEDDFNQSPLGSLRSEAPAKKSLFNDSIVFKSSNSSPEEIPQGPLCSTGLSPVAKHLAESAPLLSHPIYREPLSLIKSDENGQLHLNQKTLQFLDTLDTPLVVIGIAGSYRSGKSYLMNYLAGRQSGFQVGNTVETCTRGIWIWCLPHPLLPDTTLMWMDTEGLDDPDKGDYNFDMQVIVLSLLLSSTFIYNTQGRIDNTLIKQLGFVSDLTNHLQVRTGQEKENGDDFDLYFPNLFVVVRDFFLELKTNTASITADEYFEQCLRVKEMGGKSTGRNLRDYNEPRVKIRKFFPSSKRYCRTLPNPNKSNYRNGLLNYFLGTSKDELNPDFWVQAQELQELLLNVSPQKTFGQCDKVTGRMFGSMAQCFVAAIEQGEIPCIQSAFQLTAMQENRRILELALTEYRARMLDLVFPLSQEELYHHHQKLMRNLLEKYRKKIIFEEAHDFRQEYDNAVVSSYNEMVTHNEKKSEEYCERLLNKLNEVICKKFRSKEYLCSGGYSIYSEDLQMLKATFLSTPNTGVKSCSVLHKFLQCKESEIRTIVAIDKEMSIVRVQEEAEKRRKVEIELREKMLKAEAARAHDREEHLRKSLMVSKQQATQGAEDIKKRKMTPKKHKLAAKSTKKMGENRDTLQKEMKLRLADQQAKFELLMMERDENYNRLVKELRTEIGRLSANPVNRAVRSIATRSNRCIVM